MTRRLRFTAVALAALIAGMLGCTLMPGSLGPRSLTGVEDEDVGSGGVTSTKTPPPASALQGPIYGLVLTEAGKPAAGVPVRAFLADTSPLVGNAGSGLAGNSGGGLTGSNPYVTQAARVLAAGLETETDSSGRFAFLPDREGKFNLEAAHDDSTKAWKSSVF